MMKKRLTFNGQALRAVQSRTAGVAGAAALIGALLLAGCAGTPSAGQAAGSGVQVYGEIDVGYGHSRTRTRVQGP